MNNGQFDLLLSEVREIRKEQVRQGREIAGLKVWAWITRTAMAGLFGMMFYWVKSKLA